MSTFTEAYGAVRAEERQGRHARTPVLARIGRLAGKLTGKWERVRTNVMAVSAFGFLCLSAFTISETVGYAAIGLSLLVLEAVSGD